MIESILIANRGEIALRILRTCREMGISTVAVYSDADRELPVVREADLAVRLGPAPAVDSYLDAGRLLAIATGNGVDAIHPGYGFLAESPEFSAACAAAGVAFIGPPPEAIRSMGDKAEAKRLMRAAGVPAIPGYEGKRQGDATLRKEAEKLGYPLMVKAVAGGGGRGIRLVHGTRELAPAMASARREAASGFGDDRLMLERFFTAPRHVEFQIFADSHGNVVHLFERECSIQRRHQKVVEETPSPALGPELRAAMGEAAVRAARAIGYVGAGTVEFLLDAAGDFYFMEMNTRLQVEHPITEMTTGLDLVRLQIEVAEGRPLELRQEELRATGHAIECRLNAEIPEQGFIPAIGRLGGFTFPQGPGLRVDSGFEEGVEIGTHYDSLLAKLIAWGPTRAEALRRMGRMLEATMVSGVDHNLAFLQSVLALPAFREGSYDTRLVEERLEELIAPPAEARTVRERILAAAAVDALLEAGWTEARGAVAGGSSPSGGNGVSGASGVSGFSGASADSPWQAQRPWAAADASSGTLRRDYLFHGSHYPVEIRLLPDRGRAVNLQVTWDGLTHRAAVRPQGHGRATLEIEDVLLPLRWAAHGAERWLVLRGSHFRARSAGPDHGSGAESDEELGRRKLLAPLPGKVIRIAVKPGQKVAEHDLLAIVEAVKMEHQITAPYAGKVGRVHFKEGDPVNKDDLLLELEGE